LGGRRPGVDGVGQAAARAKAKWIVGLVSAWVRVNRGQLGCGRGVGGGVGGVERGGTWGVGGVRGVGGDFSEGKIE